LLGVAAAVSMIPHSPPSGSGSSRFMAPGVRAPRDDFC
jgi:hypothetical protein